MLRLLLALDGFTATDGFVKSAPAAAANTSFDREDDVGLVPHLGNP